MGLDKQSPDGARSIEQGAISTGFDTGKLANPHLLKMPKILEII